MLRPTIRPPTDPTGQRATDRASDPAAGRADDGPARQAADVGSPPPLEAASIAQLPSGLNVLAGMWLILAPSALGYRESGSDAMWNDSIIGAGIALLALVRVTSPRATAELSWVNFVLGAWLIVAPFVLGYGAGPNAFAATSNDIIIGLVVLVLAAWSATRGRSDRQASTPTQAEGRQVD